MSKNTTQKGIMSRAIINLPICQFPNYSKLMKKDKVLYPFYIFNIYKGTFIAKSNMSTFTIPITFLHKAL